MLIAYLLLSSVLGLLLSMIWSKDTWHNAVIKVVLISWTIWSFLLLAAAVWPLINNGSVKLI